MAARDHRRDAHLQHGEPAASSRRTSRSSSRSSPTRRPRRRRNRSRSLERARGHGAREELPQAQGRLLAVDLDRQRRGRRPARPERRRQDHRLLHDRRPRPLRRRAHHARRRGHHPLPIHARARRGIGYLPQETSIFRKPDGGRQRAGDPRDAQRPRRCGARRGAREPARGAAHRAPARSRRHERSRAASGGASRSRARWPPSPPSSCWTSPSPASTRSRCTTSSGSLGSSRSAASAC